MDQGIAFVLAAGIAATPATIAAWSSRKNYQQIKAVHEEVKTLNGKTAAIIIEEGEERRLKEIEE